jgi:hypothetical protein
VPSDVAVAPSRQRRGYMTKILMLFGGCNKTATPLSSLLARPREQTHSRQPFPLPLYARVGGLPQGRGGAAQFAA